MAATVQKLVEKSIQIESLLSQLKQQLSQARKNAVANICAQEELKYQEENKRLKQEVILLRRKLIETETKNGIIQVPMPPSFQSYTFSTSTTPQPVVESTQREKSQQDDLKKEKKVTAQKTEDGKGPNKVKKKEEKAQTKPTNVESDVNNVVDVSKLNMRIGKIVAVNKHPDADSLYVEQVDLGEGKNRVIVSGLVKHVPIEEMQDKLAVFLTNLKPAKMRGVMSEGMIMCASTSEKVEIIVPPPGVQIGERVVVEGFPGEPDEQLNPKKKTWESIQPDLKITEDGFASYKGALWTIEGKGHFKAPTLKNTPIK